MKNIRFIWFIHYFFTVLLILIGIVVTDNNVRSSSHVQSKGGELILKSGFEEGVFITPNMNKLRGSDVDGYTWDVERSWISNTSFVYLVSPNKKRTDYMESVIDTTTGPHGNQTRVLRMTNKMNDKDRSATSRNEFMFVTNEGEEEYYKEGYVKYWMKLQDNLEDIIPINDSAPFYMIMEWKERPASRKNAKECQACCDALPGGSNNYRINIGVTRDAGTKNLYWRIRAERPQPCRIEEWSYNAREHRIPLGEWFLVEAYMKKHETDGRIYFAVNEKIILDTDQEKPDGFTGRTQHPDNPLPLQLWSPMKNYHGIMKWNRLGPVSQWYDDFELWSGFPSGHPAES